MADQLSMVCSVVRLASISMQCTVKIHDTLIRHRRRQQNISDLVNALRLPSHIVELNEDLLRAIYELTKGLLSFSNVPETSRNAAYTKTERHRIESASQQRRIRAAANGQRTTRKVN